jgi:uncharacterized repeat protein (TIGR04138 family)
MMRRAEIAEIVRKDPRYAYEAYEFVGAALHFTQKMLGRNPKRGKETKEDHLSGQQLLVGIRTLALQEFGMMARTVLRLWGINKTDDFGEIVFNLVDASLMSKQPDDSREDFHDVFDLDDALSGEIEIKLEGAD